MNSALYNRDILRLASLLIAGDRLDHPHGSAEVRSPICGSRICADVEFADDGKVAALAFRANSCALGQASAAIVRGNAIGFDVTEIRDIRAGIEQALKGTGAMPSIWLDLDLLAPARDYPSRHAAILLPFDAVLAAGEQMKLAS